MKQKRKSVLDKFAFKPTSTEGKQAAIYIRVSSEEFTRNDQGEKERRQSVQTQQADAIALAEKNGWTYGIYDEDCNVSGSEDLADRPSLQRLKADIEAGKVHTVIIRELSRLFRNAALQGSYVQNVFKPYGVQVVSLSEPELNLHSPTGKLVAGIKGWQNEQFLIETSARSKRSKDNKAAEGTLRTNPPFGYGIEEKDGIRKGYIKPEEAAIIRELFQRSAAEEGTPKITQDFSARGIKPKRAKVLNAASVLSWLKNPIYKGVLIYNGKECKSPYEPIVTAKVWDDANKGIRDRANLWGVTRRASSNSHLLTGLLQCGYCCDRIEAGEQVTAYQLYRNYNKSINNTGRNIDGKGRKFYHIYTCQTKYKHNASACPESIGINAEHIEAIAKLYSTMIARDYANNLTSQAEALTAINKRIQSEEQKLQGIEKRKQDAYEMFTTGEVDKTDYLGLSKAASEALAKQEKILAGLKAQRKGIEQQADKQALEQLSQWDSLTMEQRKEGLSRLFSSFRVYADKLVITYRGSGTSVTLPITYTKREGYRVDTVKDIAELGGSTKLFEETSRGL